MQHDLRTEIDIDAAPETVWEVLTRLDRYGEWNPFIVASQGDAVIGERLTNRMRPPGGKEVTFRPVVTVVEPTETFEWFGRLVLPGLFDGRHRFELSPTEAGGTHLVQSEKFTGLLVRFARKSLDAGTASGFDAMNVALKDRAEVARRP